MHAGRTTGRSGEPVAEDERADRLRAAFGLLFDEPTAARLAGSAGSDESSLRRCCRRAGRRYTLLRLRRARHRPLPGDPPLAPHPRLDARAALALALHLALELDSAALARLFGGSPEQIADDLDRARRAADPACPAPCGEAPALARYREPLDPATHLALASHLRGCPACQAALEGYRRVDQALLTALARPPAPRTPLRPAARPWRGRALRLSLPLAGLLLVTALAGAGVKLAGRLGAAHAQPVPLLAQPAAPNPEGWLLELDANRQPLARALPGGQAQPLGLSNPLGVLDTPFVAPAGDAVAVWTRPYAQTFPISESAVTPGWLTMTDLSGAVRWRRAFDSSDTSWRAAGWLGDRFLLVAAARSVTGVPGAPEASEQRRLVTVDGAGGEPRTLFQGEFAGAQPSPDGSLVALMTSDPAPSTGSALELRRVAGDSLGAPLVRLDNLAGNVIWAPDGSQLLAALLPDDGADPVNYALLDRDGHERPLALPAGATPVALAPGGDVITLSAPLETSQPGRRLLRVPLDGGAPVPLLDTPVRGVTGPALSAPDQHALLLTVVRDAYLAPDPPGDHSDAVVTEFLRIDAAGQARPLAGQPGSAAQALAWLPQRALPAPQPPADTPIQASAPEPVPGLAAEQLAAGDSLDPSGRWLLLDDGGQAVLWNRALGQAQPLPAGLDDPSWLPGGLGLIGVLAADEGGREVSRLALYTTRTNLGLDQSSATQLFDPAGLGDRAGLRYARPLAAPDGEHTAFFVIDSARQQVALWLTGSGLPARAVDEWPWPAAQRDDVPLAVAWVDGTTLVAARSDDWQGGLPQRVTLLRLTLGPGDAVVSAPLRTLHSLGGDRGIALEELALRPNQAGLAYRLRHFSRLGSEVIDTITVAPAADLERGIELARGGAGQGLTWSPDGSQLAAALDGRIVRYAPSGASSSPLTPAGAEAGDPIWLGDQLWFNLSDDTGRGLRRIPAPPPAGQ
ncbi:MAG TPA: hypothetical protein VFI42_10030 [Thermomicrobiaceae bacterium]|nr:hypothetical protein [Thermomicrobiaceae bacterium]